MGTYALGIKDIFFAILATLNKKLMLLGSLIKGLTYWGYLW
jgi:hypothetical protein